MGVRGRPSLKWDDKVLEYLKARQIGDGEAWRMEECNVWIGTDGDFPGMTTPLKKFPGAGITVD